MASTLPNLGLWFDFEQCDADILQKLSDNFLALDVKNGFGVTRGAALPASPSLYDQFIFDSGDSTIYTWDGTVWVETPSRFGLIGFDVTPGLEGPIIFDGADWVPLRDFISILVVNSLGTGIPVLESSSGNTINLRSIKGVPGRTSVSGSNGEIEIDTQAVFDGENLNPSDASNANIFETKSGDNLRFKSLRAGSNVTIAENAGFIEIASTGGGGGGSTTPVWNFRSVTGATTVLSDDKYLRGNISALTFPDALTTLGQTVFVIGDFPTSFSDNNGALTFDESLVYGYYRDTQLGTSVPVYAFVAGSQGVGGNTWFQLSDKTSDFDNTTTNLIFNSNGAVANGVNHSINLAYGTGNNTTYFDIIGANAPTAKIAGLYFVSAVGSFNYTGNLNRTTVQMSVTPSNTVDTLLDDQTVTEKAHELTGGIQYSNLYLNGMRVGTPIYLKVGESFTLDVIQSSNPATSLNVFSGSIAITKIG